MKKAAVSACLAGRNCRYNGEIKADPELLRKLGNRYEVVLFCPEDACFGTPREAMDLMVTDGGIRALCKYSREDRTDPVIEYAQRFFDSHPDIDLFVGKARSPSCGVRSALLYDSEGDLVSDDFTGIMAAEALSRGIEALDNEDIV